MKLDLLKGSRSQFLVILLTGVMILIVVRLFWLQIVQHDHYTALANREQMKHLVIPANRGMIYALDGTTPAPLVMNQQVYTVFADPTVITKHQEVEQVVREVAAGEMVDGDIQEMLQDTSTQYKVLARNVSLRQAELIREKKLSGVGFQQVSKRVYTEGQLASQTLGFVNNENKGQYGVEERLNDRLTGTDGVLKSVTDVANVPLSIGKNNIRQDPVDGESLVLTLDLNIQSKAEQVLAAGLERSGATDGSIMVMDPNTGQIKAMASLPTYKPEEFTKVQDAKQFVNRTVSEPYEPGSVLKTFTVATGIDMGVITPDATFYNTDSVRIEDRTIGNVVKGLTGNISMQTALNNSLNTGMVNIAQRLGNGEYITKGARDTMYEYFHNRFGLGELTGIQVTNEQRGTVISPDEAEGNAVRYSNMAFGQGLNVTMVQVCAGFSSIINGGTYHSPSVIAGTYEDGQIRKEDNATHRKGVISTEASQQTREMIYKARNGFTSDDKPGYYVGGKTGTAQTIENGQYVMNQTDGTYLGFGGTKSESKYVIMVQVSGKGMNLEGNRHAMPIFTDLSNWLLEYYQLQPGE